MIGCTLDNTLLELILTDGRKRVGRRRSHLHEWMRRDVTIIENVDKSKFVATMGPATTEFEKQFGKANLDRIRNYK